MDKGIIEVLQTEMLDFVSPILINNLPAIDGLLVSQRQVIWGMKKANMTSDKQFFKMLKATGRIFSFYTLGDMPLCGVMKNMGNNFILNKYLMTKGSFGNKNFRNSKGAAARYIECKLNPYAEYMLEGINKKAVPMKSNYDSTEKEPIVLPSIIPNILTNLRMSIAVSEANKMPSHNMEDTCNSIISYIKTKDINKSIELIKVPDLPSGGSIVYDKKTFTDIYKTGRGSFTILGKYKYDKQKNMITIYEIPYTTYAENIMDELDNKFDKFKSDFSNYPHNGSDKDGLKINLYLKRGTNVDSVIQKLRKYTSFESKFACNFTILDLDGKTPILMSLEDIIGKWVTHRQQCIINEYKYDISEKENKLHKLYGLRIITNDLDKAISIIRNSKKESIAVQELINYFNLTKEQADYIATIKLLNINQEWIFNKISDIDNLEKEVKELKENINNIDYINNIIISQLEDVKKKFGQPRKTEIIMPEEISTISKEDLIEDFNCKLLYTKDGYIKKLLKTSDTQKLKDGDEIIDEIQSTNKSTIFIFTNKANRYKLNCYELEENKPSTLGTYMYSLFDFEEDEKIIKVVSIEDEEKGYMINVFENGNIAKVKIKSYFSNNTKLANCYGTAANLSSMDYISKDCDILLLSTEGKVVIINTSNFNPKQSRNVNGDAGMKLPITDELTENKIVKSFINVPRDLNFKITTEKGRIKEFYLDDVAPTGNENEQRSAYDYFKGNGNRNRGGNFVINTRPTNDKIISVCELK